MILWQEGAKQISVFALVTRTTASLEAYNGILGKRIMTNPNFFVLINTLKDEEFNKSRDFDLLLQGANPPLQKRHYRLRDNHIRKLSKSIENKEISSDVFLNAFVFEENGLLNDHCTFALDISDDDTFTSDEEEKEQSENAQSASVISGATCVICYEQQSDVLLSCGHYKHCISCFETARAHYDEKLEQYQAGNSDIEPIFKCPLCNKHITQHMHVKKIFS